MSMWEPFTPFAQRSIALAQEEARRLGSNVIATEHMLLGIMGQDESLAVKVLQTLGVDFAQVRQDLEAAGQRGETAGEEMVFAPRSKRAIELAFEEARRLNHNYIGTETLLLGLIREGDGTAARVLRGLGLTPEEMLLQTKLLLSE